MIIGLRCWCRSLSGLAHFFEDVGEFPKYYLYCPETGFLVHPTPIRSRFLRVYRGASRLVAAEC